MDGNRFSIVWKREAENTWRKVIHLQVQIDIETRRQKEKKKHEAMY